MPPRSEPDRLRSIRTLPSLVAYLRDELDWPIESDDVEEISFSYDPDELGLDAKHAAKINHIKQIRPLHSGQPWGIFWVSFEKKRLPVVVLRRILANLVVKSRQSANSADRPRWKMNDLLFISAYGDEDTAQREIAFAHFKQTDGDMPTLHVLGWDGGDTVLKLENVAQILTQKLHWPRNPADADSWRRQWSSAFRHRLGHVVRTAESLAEILAALARNTRDAASKLLEAESDKGALTRLYRAFQTALIHDLTKEDFADTYAQTITYGLLTAAISRNEMSNSRDGTTLIAENITDMVPVTNPFLKEMLQTFLHAGGRKGGIDFDELGVQDVVELLRGDETDLPAILRDFGNKTRGEDPVIHFYEHFLSAYNKTLKVQRGVFYTPQPVVSYIVRSVHELLQTEFGLADGLADITTWGEMVKQNPDLKLPPLTDDPGEKRTISPDEPFVQVLDPATGTATFLVEVIDIIHRTLAAKWTQQRLSDAQQSAAWNEYVPTHLLRRLHAFELMMAPYAIAHMKIGLKLAETGYRFGTEERARIYLTNALEPWAKQLSLAGFDALAHEAAAVNEIKRHKRFTVVVGNPPYSILSANMSDSAKALVEQYRYINGVRIRERGALKAEVILQDDYVKFLGFAQNTIRIAGTGTVGMITNANCYMNPVLRGVRYALHSQFQVIHAADLGGQSKAGIDQDKNVFDIDTSVAVSLLVQLARPERFRGIAKVAGSRRAKYETLLTTTSATLCATRFDPKPEQYLFKAFASSLGDEYSAGFPIDRAFGITSIGIKTARDHLVLDFDRASVAERIASLRDTRTTAAELRERFGISDNTQWKFVEALPKFRATFQESHFAVVEARPFDRRWLYFHPSLVFNTRPGINRHLHGRRNLCLLAMRRIRTEDYAHFFVTSRIGMGEIISSADNCNFFPLYLFHNDPLTPNASGEPNLTRDFLAALGSRLDAKLGTTYSPEDVFHYAYAVFHSPSYRSRYAEFLRIDFPRLPLTGNLDLFRALARLGSELVALHLMESPTLDNPVTEFTGGHSPEVEKVSWSKNTVWVNKAQTTGFTGVREEVWNFHIGGYQVCEKWLKDRKGRILTMDDIIHYRKIAIALDETIDSMKKVDEVIEQHGGWPVAFAPTIAAGRTSGTEMRYPDIAAFQPWDVGELQHPLFEPEQLPLRRVAETPQVPYAISPATTSDSEEKAQPVASDSAEIMCNIRQLFSDGAERARDVAIAQLSSGISSEGIRAPSSEEFAGAIRAAVRRGILENTRGSLRIAWRSIEQYERGFLKDQFIASLGGAWTTRDDAIRGFARWLGFRRTGPAINEAAKSAINGLIREDRLESDGSRVRRVR